MRHEEDRLLRELASGNRSQEVLALTLEQLALDIGVQSDRTKPEEFTETLTCWIGDGTSPGVVAAALVGAKAQELNGFWERFACAVGGRRVE